MQNELSHPSPTHKYTVVFKNIEDYFKETIYFTVKKNMVKVSQFRWTKERNINLKKELLVFLTIYFFNNYFDKNCDDNMDAFQSCSESASFGIVASILLYDFSKFNKFLKGSIDQCVK